ncbi:acylglycerol kinase family protein [Sporobolomyces koalae]|uniref:acylglycerol kinase family protein n=1 Tax=Sporobolomyces koalae TaxID=500713 RepID=UPI003177C82E
MIHTTSYVFSHLSPDGATLYITPHTPIQQRDPTDLDPIQVSQIAYFVRDQDESEPTSLTCFYIDRDSELSYTMFKFVLDPESPPLPSQLDHLVVASGHARSKRVELVLNPKSGHGYATALLDDVVKPLLAPFVQDLRVWETLAENDGERIGREIIQARGGQDTTVIIFGGDGTVHEMLNGAVLPKESKPSRLDLVLIPCGTANALYYHLFPPEAPEYPVSSPHSPFYSLLAFLRGQAQPLPLPLALNTIRHAAAEGAQREPVPPVLTSVVTSGALHACLLHDAEALRSSHPGLERFKIAAQQNVKNWWNGTLSLRHGAKRYDSTSQTFVEPELGNHLAQNDNGEIQIGGPFAYWVSSLVSRFEPSFVVAPLRSPLHALAPSQSRDDDATIDLILIRPLRHRPTDKAFASSSGSDEQGDIRRGFADRVWQVTGGMYDGGKHVDMVYPAGEGSDDGSIKQGSTEIVEVWRTKGFEWTPTVSSDFKSNLVCLDGALHDLERGGSLVTRVLASQETGVRVCA